MNLLKNNLLLFLFVSVLIFTSCENEENANAKKETLFGLTSQNDDMSTLKKALEITGLNSTLEGSNMKTLFAPSNTAFSNFLAENGFNSIDEVPVNTLKELLLNHVIDGRIKEQDLPNNTYIKSNAIGYASSTNALSLYFRTTESGITINGMADLTGQTLLASNGIIHKINHVLELPSIMDHIVANPNLSILAGALETNTDFDFAAELSSINNGPYTMIAPLNSGFSTLSSDLPAASQATMAQVLKYHVILTSNSLSNTLTDGASINTFAGDSFTIQSTPANFRIKDYNNRLANFTTKDIQCYNGVIHVVDRFLIPNLN
ncbi:MAG: fasciclin domain-containing protein [Flavobacterium sp.]|nr:fasciclin domain-containing protein [Flavobacterium sp.]